MSVKVLGDGPKPPMQCPDPDRIAAYLDDGLFEEERRTLEEHFASCEDCWQIFSNAVEYIAQRRAQDVAAGVKPENQLHPRRGIWARRNKWTAVAALLALSITGSWWWLRGSSSRAVRTTQVAAAEAGWRPIVPRLTLAQWGQRPESPYRSATVPARRERGLWRYGQLLEAALAAAERSPDAAHLQRLGGAYLLAGHSDEAVKTLERAAAAAPRNAETLSDLAAAYVARGLELDDASSVADGIEMVGRALELDSDLAVARFNRAVALEALPLRSEALVAWRDYLAIDSISPWAGEAKNRLRELERHIVAPKEATVLRREIADAATAKSQRLADLVAAHRQETREAVVLDLLPAWGAATLKRSKGEAAARLQAANELATVWREQTNDESLLRQIADIAGAGRDEQRFAHGHQALAKGIEALEEMRVEQARSLFTEARRQFPAEAAAAGWPPLYLVACDYYLQGTDPDLNKRLDSLAGWARKDVPLRAYIAWLHGLLYFARGEPAAIAHYDRALRELERLDEANNVAWLHSLSGDVYAIFGDQPRAWEHRRAVLAALPRLTNRQRAFEIVLAPAIAAAYLEERPHVAATLLAALARPGNHWTVRRVAELQLWRARVAMELGDRRTAEDSWQAGTARLAQVDDPVMRQRLAGDLQAAWGSIAASPTAAVTALSASIERARSGEPDFRYPALLLERARAFRRLGELSRAAADLRQGVDWLLRRPAVGPVQTLWSDRLAGGDALFSELVEVELARGDGRAALLAAEATRSWHFDRAERRTTSAQRVDFFSRRHLREGLDSGTTVLYYELLANEAILWRLDAAEITMIRLAAKPAEIRAWAAQLQADLADGAWTSATRAVARSLYAALVEPASLTSHVQRLVVVADGPLDQLPFSALVGPSGRYLIENQSIEVVPSIGAYFAARARALRLSDGTPSVLAIGGSLPDRDLYPDLEALPAAASEAESVASSYRRRDLLTRKDATREALVTLAGEYRVVHYAGHAVVNSVDPSRSSLVLARDDASNRAGALFAFELHDVRFSNTRLVVLSGCGTGSGPLRSRAGTLSLARAFLAADVPAVIASLWLVSDGSTTQLMTTLHQSVARGEDPAVALRAAQLASLRSSDPALNSPAIWAAFGVLGG